MSAVMQPGFAETYSRICACLLVMLVLYGTASRRSRANRHAPSNIVLALATTRGTTRAQRIALVYLVVVGAWRGRACGILAALALGRRARGLGRYHHWRDCVTAHCSPQLHQLSGVVDFHTPSLPQHAWGVKGSRAWRLDLA